MPWHGCTGLAWATNEQPFFVGTIDDYDTRLTCQRKASCLQPRPSVLSTVYEYRLRNARQATQQARLCEYFSEGRVVRCVLGSGHDVIHPPMQWAEATRVGRAAERALRNPMKGIDRIDHLQYRHVAWISGQREAVHSSP